MASIPLPALHTAPIEQPPNIIQMYGQIMGIKNAQQELTQRQAMAPLEQQQAQQAVQSGQLDVEAKQRAAADQKAMSAAMREWSAGASGSSAGASGNSAAQPSVTATTGAVTDPDTGATLSPGGAGGQGAPAGAASAYDSLIAGAIKHGASFQAVQALQEHVNDMKAKVAATLKDDAQAGTAKADTIKANNGIISDAMLGVMSLPDGQLAPGLLSAGHELQAKGLLDPQHMQMVQALSNQAMQGDAAGVRTQLDLYNKSLGAYSKELDLQGKQTANQEAQQTADFRKQNNLPAGVSSDEMGMADWLKKNPGKGPSDYKLWTLEHTPTAMMMGNQLAGDQNAAALDFAANAYRNTLQMPAGLARSPATTRAIIARAAELDQQAGGSGGAANRAILTASADSLKKLQTNFDQVQAFEQTAEKNMDLLQQTAAKIPDLNTRFANIAARNISSQMIGTDNMAAYKTALTTAQTEAAKVLNSSNATGVLSDSARHELQDVIDGNVPYSAMVASLNTLKQDMANRTQSYQAQIQDIQNRIKGAGQPSGGTGGAGQAGPASGSIENGYRFKGGDPSKQANWEKVQQ